MNFYIMALIELSIGRSKYKIECPQSEENKLMTLATKMDERVKNLSQNFKNIDEKTLLIISSLMMEDEIESNKKPQDVDKIYENLTHTIENMTQNIEKLARKIESY